MNTFLKLKCNHNGFTLIEIAAVLVIIAILSTLAVKHMGSSNISAYGEADRLVADLRYAQSLAMSRGMDVQVSFNSNGWDWEIKDGLSFADGETSRNIQQEVSISSGTSVIFKYPSGKIDSDQTIELKRGSYTIDIKVYGETGYVEIQ